MNVTEEVIISLTPIPDILGYFRFAENSGKVYILLTSFRNVLFLPLASKTSQRMISHNIRGLGIPGILLTNYLFNQCSK